MRILAFDTETTGLCDHKLPIESPRHPYLVQLGAVLFESSPVSLKYEKIASVDLIRAPLGLFEIPTQASDVHGITTQKAEEVGVNISLLMASFVALLAKCDMTICFNSSYDMRIMGGELTRSQSPRKASHLALLSYIKNLCLKEEMTPVMKLPGKFGDYKWPKLSEAYEFCMGKEIDGAHNALVDVEATIDVFKWFERRQLEEKGN